MSSGSTVICRHALPALVAVAAACGPATNSHYPGEPLATIHGQLTVPQANTISGPVRLAVAWYILNQPSGPTASTDLGTLQTIFTQDVEYQGVFPIDYSFSLYQPPPPEALQELWQPGNGSKWAVGIVIAYQDLNNNGKLDIISTAGSPVDKVLGTSVGDFYLYTNYDQGAGLLGTTGFQLVYFDGPSGSSSFQSGFNLVQNSPYGVVPTQTRVPIDLTGSWTNDLFVCNVQFYRASPPWQCGVTPPRDLLLVRGVIGRSATNSFVSLTVTNALSGNFISGASVRVNGRVIPFRPLQFSDGSPWGDYQLDEASFLVAAGAPNDLRVHANGFGDFDRVIAVPDGFQLISPAPNATLHPDVPFEIAWTVAAEASAYATSVAQTIPFGAIGSSFPQPGSSFTWTWPFSGPARITVDAYKFFPSNIDGSYVSGRNSRSVDVQFQR